MTFDNERFIIPSKVCDRTVDATFKNGRSVFCVDGKSILSPTAFPTVQARVMKTMGSTVNNPIMAVTKTFIEFQHQTIALTKEGEEEGQNAINFAVVYKDEDPEACYRDLEEITAIIVTTLYSVSPGTSIMTGIYLCDI